MSIEEFDLFGTKTGTILKTIIVIIFLNLLDKYIFM
jgi:hypothetical protein